MEILADFRGCEAHSSQFLIATYSVSSESSDPYVTPSQFPLIIASIKNMNRNKKILYKITIHYLTDRTLPTEMSQKYEEGFYGTGKQLEEFLGAIERAHLRQGGKVAEFITDNVG